MAEYLALDRVALHGGVVEPGSKFSSDDVPGRYWKPIDKDAKAAVRARDEARKAAAEEVVFVAGDGEPDPRIAEMEAALKEAEDLAKLRDEEITALTVRAEAAEAALFKFDGDGDGKPGGSKPKTESETAPQ